MNPEPNLLLSDRFLVMLSKKDIPAAICFNKADITDTAAIGHYSSIYERAGYRVFVTSAKEGVGREDLLQYLSGRLTAFAGPSGVGKSSLMNMLTGEERAETGEVSKKTGHGKQTTRASSVYVVSKDTFVIDTPGFGSIDISDIEKEDLADYFPEMAARAGECRFSTCAHISEPDCGIRKAVADGIIATERYENYCSIYEDIAATRKY